MKGRDGVYSIDMYNVPQEEDKDKVTYLLLLRPRRAE